MGNYELVIDYSNAVIAVDDLSHMAEGLKKDANDLLNGPLESIEPMFVADDALGKYLTDLLTKARSRTFGCMEVAYRMEEISEALQRSADRIHKKANQAQ